MQERVQHGHLLQTGNKTRGTLHYFRVTDKATPEDLVRMTRIRQYLVTDPNKRQPSIRTKTDAILQFARFEDQGKVVEVKPRVALSVEPKRKPTLRKPVVPMLSQKPIEKDKKGKILNPLTGRYVLKTGKVGKTLVDLQNLLKKKKEIVRDIKYTN